MSDLRNFAIWFWRRLLFDRLRINAGFSVTIQSACFSICLIVVIYSLRMLLAFQNCICAFLERLEIDYSQLAADIFAPRCPVTIWAKEGGTVVMLASFAFAIETYPRSFRI